jgi:hypothetical protein
MVKLCLTMILTDEEKIIGECLKMMFEGIKFDALAIDFNGKRKDTPDIIKKFCVSQGIPLSLRYTVWTQDFEAARTAVLNQATDFCIKLNSSNISINEQHVINKMTGPLTAEEWDARGKIISKIDDTWYIVNHDADNTLVNASSFDKNILTADLITVTMSTVGGDPYSYRWMTKVDPYRKKLWRWYQPVHEALDKYGNWEMKAQHVNGIKIISGRHGARGADGQRAKYLRDAVALNVWRNKPENRNSRRALFYEAQSWKDAGYYEEALKLYAECGTYDDGFVEEKYLSLLNAGRISMMIHPDKPGVALEYFHRAHETVPRRLEALHEIAKYHLNRKNNLIGWAIVKPWIDNKQSGHILWTETNIYEYEFFEVAGVLAFRANEKNEAKKLFAKALESKRLSDTDRTRIKQQHDGC